MNDQLRRILGVLAVLAIALAIISANSRPLQASGSAPVTVVNTPLPVTGSVTGTVTGTVSISGTPTVSIAGTPTVALSGTPTVKVDSTTPLTVSQAPHEPFQVGIDVPIASGPTSVISGTFTVPAGKRLAIEYFSARVYHNNCLGCTNDPISNFGFFIDTSVGGNVVRHFVPVGPTEFSVNGANDAYQFVAGQKVALYADPGTQVVLSVSRRYNGYTGDVTFGVSGYLEDAQ